MISSLSGLSGLGGGGMGGGISAPSATSGDIKSPVSVGTEFETGDGQRAVNFHIATSGSRTNQTLSDLSGNDMVGPARNYFSFAPIEFVMLGGLAILAGVIIKLSTKG